MKLMNVVDNYYVMTTFQGDDDDNNHRYTTIKSYNFNR